ncbi:hypothetical protein N7532_001105 [Penicillium argentinense]|uniref:CENP-V/GFA domain-containing protein n=1 Tax=Penicillium argentinense TaxID=1131581 RepID=A0A9W9G2Q2_9EURO|nr:uncharacterized protein N7532_001105 [Penicillium argentinense]KAJ5110570.1 hypothetical protein N7532_001105 [Penicillium argentinense]
MPGSGNCLCGSIAFEYTGEPALTALCHCTACQQWGGSAFSSNVAVLTTNFAITKGTPKTWARTGDLSGKKHHLFFCGDCGTSIFSQPEGMPGVTQIKSGNMKNSNIPIMAEIFVTRRRDFVTAVAGSKQAPEMP